MAVAGAMVFIGHDGKVKVERGLIRREDMRRGGIQRERWGRGGDGGGRSGQAETHPFRTAHAHADRTPHRRHSSLDCKPCRCGAGRRGESIGRAAVCRLPQPTRVVVQISLEQATLKTMRRISIKAAQLAVIEEKFTLWASRVEAIAGSDTSLFGLALQQPQEDVLDLLALCVSASVNTVTSREDCTRSGSVRPDECAES